MELKREMRRAEAAAFVARQILPEIMKLKETETTTILRLARRVLPQEGYELIKLEGCSEKVFTRNHGESILLREKELTEVVMNVTNALAPEYDLVCKAFEDSRKNPPYRTSFSLCKNKDRTRHLYRIDVAYIEPSGYIPKEILEKYFGKE